MCKTATKSVFINKERGIKVTHYQGPYFGHIARHRNLMHEIFDKKNGRVQRME